MTLLEPAAIESLWRAETLGTMPRHPKTDRREHCVFVVLANGISLSFDRQLRILTEHAIARQYAAVALTYDPEGALALAEDHAVEVVLAPLPERDGRIERIEPALDALGVRLEFTRDTRGQRIRLEMAPLAARMLALGIDPETVAAILHSTPENLGQVTERYLGLAGRRASRPKRAR